ncbi:MAG: DoxX family protein [Enterovirga sp.]|nr:DoxX family protein [Enterovirga sp.]
MATAATGQAFGRFTYLGSLMSRTIDALLLHRGASVLARILLTFPFWGSGLDKLFGFDAAVAVLEGFGLRPGALFAAATVTVQLVGSALVISNRLTWLGAGALGIFTALTIPLVHRFWALDGEASVHAFHIAAEHVGMIGGLVTVSILAALQRAARANPSRLPGSGAVALP